MSQTEDRRTPFTYIESGDEGDVDPDPSVGLGRHFQKKMDRRPNEVLRKVFFKVIPMERENC